MKEKKYPHVFKMTSMFAASEEHLRELSAGNPQTLEKAFNPLTEFPEDFFSEGRKDTPPQGRDF